MTADLIKKAAGGDVGAFEKLITEHEKHIFNVAYRMLGNVEDAKDISQEAIIKIYKNIDRCADIKAFKGWITTITTNACIDFLRRKKRYNALSLDAEIETEDGTLEMQLPSDELSPEEQLIYHELRSDIAAAMRRLPDSYRIFIVMRDIYGYSYNEIASHMGVQLGTVKSRISRARNILRTELQKTEPKNDLSV
ncbi:MAG: sigma-70 family RNA polymerase sigma factor [Defluviitaleaceae bacterium]|nr:sigma-70 family RNA polymerase sigma factor [Defluviitaleaceae bacterium]